MIENPEVLPLSSMPLTFFGMTYSPTSCVTAVCGMEKIATTADKEVESMGQRVDSEALEDFSLLWWDVSCRMVPYGLPSFAGEECSRMSDLGAGKRVRFLGCIVQTLKC